jgi:Domain of unknown function (DUF1929)
LIRLSSVTHAFNQSQLIFPLTFAKTGSTSKAIGLANARLAPPGTLYALPDQRVRVPSVAKTMVIGP